MSLLNDWRWNPQWKKAHLAVEVNEYSKRRYVMACGKEYSDWYTGYAGKFTNPQIKCEKCNLVATMRELAE